MTDDPLGPHRHDPNPEPPGTATAVTVCPPRGPARVFSVERLHALPARVLDNCYIVSTGHGTSGPFRFQGPALAEVARQCGLASFRRVAVISGDGFGTRLPAADARGRAPAILALAKDGQALTRAEGLVRLIVPTEKDDALKQVKWIARIEFEA